MSKFVDNFLSKSLSNYTLVSQVVVNIMHNCLQVYTEIQRHILIVLLRLGCFPSCESNNIHNRSEIPFYKEIYRFLQVSETLLPNLTTELWHIPTGKVSSCQIGPVLRPSPDDQMIFKIAFYKELVPRVTVLVWDKSLGELNPTFPTW